MDEPTAAISVRQVAEVLNLIRRLRDQAIAVVLISHRMPDVFAVADRIVVLRRGESREALGGRVKDLLRSDAPPAAPPPAGSPPPPRRPPNSPKDGYWRRRLLAVGALVAAIVVVVLIGAAVHHLAGDGEATVATQARPAKTITIPEGYDRREIAAIAEEAGLRGDYLKASESYKGFDPARYGAQSPQSLEGFLFPATYELPRHATDDELVAAPAGGLQAVHLAGQHALRASRRT